MSRSVGDKCGFGIGTHLLRWRVSRGLLQLVSKAPKTGLRLMGGESALATVTLPAMRGGASDANPKGLRQSNRWTADYYARPTVSDRGIELRMKLSSKSPRPQPPVGAGVGKGWVGHVRSLWTKIPGRLCALPHKNGPLRAHSYLRPQRTRFQHDHFGSQDSQCALQKRACCGCVSETVLKPQSPVGALNRCVAWR